MGRGKNWATQNWAEKAEIAETRLAEEDWLGPRDTSDRGEVGRDIEILLDVVLSWDSSATKIETSSSVVGKMMYVVQCLTTSFLPSLKFRGAAGKKSNAKRMPLLFLVNV